MKVSPMNKPLDISKAEEIFGWMSSQELTWLAEQASSHCLLAELGTYNGRSTRALADNTSGIIWAIDTWEKADYMPQLSMEPWIAFQLNLADHLDSGRVRAVKINHKDIHPFALSQLRRLDFVFIDGDHSVEAVRRDILE